MLAMADAGFVFLSMTKSGSTAIQQEFQRHAQLVVRRPPRMKHMQARTFESVWAPVLERYGYPRSSYELVCVVRHPVDWAASWWRFRSRPQARRNPGWTGEVTFEEFARQIVDGEIDLGSSARFVGGRDGQVLVDRIYRYEHLADAAAWMADRLGIPAPELPPANVSPRRELVVDPGVRTALLEHYAADLAVYESGL